MRIERLEIGGFGRFANVGWELDPGLTVMIGENEAGKTTMLNALRAILFGFELSRDGRAWYPALAGGRRGGRMTIVTAAGERWTVERHGPRGGAGSLTVRAPSGNQGGQETLDRLLHGADRDLFNSIFAFGLGELQDFNSLGGEGVRGRIYGAAAGLGGTSALDLERRLRQEQEDLFRPSGRLQPINQLLSRMDELHARIGELTRQPEEFEAAHRERVAAQAAAASRRTSARQFRARALRLERLLNAAPIAALLDELDAELAGMDPALDALPADAVAILDRRLADLAEARARLEALDEQLAEMAVQVAGLSIDERVMGAADEIRALDVDRRAYATRVTRRHEASAAEARHAATVAEQLARVGAWQEGHLVALDDSIPAVEATREHERALGHAREAAAAADRRHRAAADELAAREREGLPAAGDDTGDAQALAALREIATARARRATGSPLGRPAMIGVIAVALLVAGLVVGIALQAAIPGVIVGGLLALGTVALSLLGSPGARSEEHSSLLAAAGLPPGATDDDLARRGDELAEARVRRSLARELAGSVDTRRGEVRRLDEAQTAASAAAADAEAAWDGWLDAHGLPAGASPEVIRQVLGAAGIARRAAEERDEQRRIMTTVAREGDDLDRRARGLLERLAIGEEGPLDGRLAGLVDRLKESSADHRTAQEIEARRRTVIERRGPVDASVKDLSSSVNAHLVAVGCADADELRGRSAAAAERRAVQQRLRETRANLAGIAGGPEAVDGLRAELRERDLSEVEVELDSSSAEATLLEAEERRLTAQIGELDARIRTLESADELGMLRQELAGLEGRASALSREWAVRAVAGRLLAETRSRYERERQPDVVRAASSHFERFTGGRYATIIAPPGDATVRVETDDGESLATDELSRGTAEQLYLALRFGLIEEFAQHAEPLPVVMDDILVNFDAARAARAADAIRDLAERHQVVFFTCHEPMAQLLDPDGTRTVALA
ncbi:MAG: AAA family ATPase [Chloroflexi bacterium]|nr:AAA family ATPase [Chloroflexota bacterium]